jgi:peptide/nickel transport system permease protein
MLTILSMLIAVAIALPVGIASAVWRGSALDQTALSVSMFTASIPSFWLGLILMQFFAVKLGWFPVAGYGGPGATFLERMSHLVLPAIVLGLVNSALITRFTRASMLDVMNDDYVRTARAKGLPQRKIVLHHALRGAVLPLVSYLGPAVAGLITGSLVVEQIFNLPGLGKYFVISALQRDYTVVMGVVILYAALIMLMNLVSDVLYAVLDPRVRLS